MYDRVDDAVCAVRSALEEGILPGAGRALASINVLKYADHTNTSQAVAAKMLATALQAPQAQILANAGLNSDDIYSSSTPSTHGYNVKTQETGDLMAMGVIDPLKVTRSALQNAASVAATILSTNAIVTMARSYDATN